MKSRWMLCASLLLGASCGDAAEVAEGPFVDKSPAQASDASSDDHSGHRDASAAPVGTGAPADASVPTTSAPEPPTNVADAGVVEPSPEPARDAGTPSAQGKSSGCGVSATGAGKFVDKTIRVGTRDRSYHVRLPTGYDSNRAYPVIYRFHGTGGDGLSGGLDIEYSADRDAIIVAPDGLNSGWSGSTREDDIALFDAMHAATAKSYCVDLDRVFSYGFSAGGFMTNALGCRRGDVIRATAAVAGGSSSGTCQGTIAAWFLHDTDDGSVPISSGRAARDRVLAANGCSMQTTDVGDGCVRYQGCRTEDPVVWCESNGIGHNIRGDFAPPLVWEFFSTLP